MIPPQSSTSAGRDRKSGKRSHPVLYSSCQQLDRQRSNPGISSSPGSEKSGKKEKKPCTYSSSLDIFGGVRSGRQRTPLSRARRLLRQTLPARCLIYGSSARARTGGAAAPGLAAGTGALGQVHPDRCSVTLSLPARREKPPGEREEKGAESGIQLGDNEFQVGGCVLPPAMPRSCHFYGAGDWFVLCCFFIYKCTDKMHVFIKE